jgi:hypothetical protein
MIDSSRTFVLALALLIPFRASAEPTGSTGLNLGHGASFRGTVRATLQRGQMSVPLAGKQLRVETKPGSCVLSVDAKRITGTFQPGTVRLSHAQAERVIGHLPISRLERTALSLAGPLLGHYSVEKTVIELSGKNGGPKRATVTLATPKLPIIGSIRRTVSVALDSSVASPSTLETLGAQLPSIVHTVTLEAKTDLALPGFRLSPLHPAAFQLSANR